MVLDHDENFDEFDVCF